MRVPVDRRGMLRRCLALLGLAKSATGKAAGPAGRYLPLQDRVVVDQQRLAEPWQPLPFKAWCVKPPGGEDSGREVLLKGMLLRVRTPGAAPPEESFRAYCLNCPHELCDVSFITDTGSVRIGGGKKPAHPLFVCPCHFSVFDPAAEGARIFGPSHRGLFAFQIEVRAGRVEIQAVERDALG